SSHEDSRRSRLLRQQVEAGGRPRHPTQRRNDVGRDHSCVAPVPTSGSVEGQVQGRPEGFRGGIATSLSVVSMVPMLGTRAGRRNRAGSAGGLSSTRNGWKRDE